MSNELNDNQSSTSARWLVAGVVLLVLFLDQLIKFTVKLNMTMNQEIHLVGHWLIIHFTENPGMAFGYEFHGQYGKTILSLLRILFIGVIGWYLFQLSGEKKVHKGFLVCMSLIFAGALGNLIDSAFYGMIFSDSGFIRTAHFLPAEGGYAGFLHGKVVDMFYFPIIHFHKPLWWPNWGPFTGTDHAHCDNPRCPAQITFFQPIFNVADSAISLGVFSIFILQRRFFRKKIVNKHDSGIEA